MQQLQDEADPMDWQTAALFLAVLACLLFFIVAACILVHHMRQWRRMERRLDQGKLKRSRRQTQGKIKEKTIMFIMKSFAFAFEIIKYSLSIF